MNLDIVMNLGKASDYAGMNFVSIAEILSARVEQAKGFLSYGVYSDYPDGYLKYYRSDQLNPETIPSAYDAFETDKPNARIFPRNKLQAFLDLLQHDEDLLKLIN